MRHRDHQPTALRPGIKILGRSHGPNLPHGQFGRMINGRKGNGETNIHIGTMQGVTLSYSRTTTCERLYSLFVPVYACVLILKKSRDEVFIRFVTA